MLILSVRFQDEVAAARPEIDARTEQLVSKGRWDVPGYKVGDIGILEWLRRWPGSIALTGTLGEIWGSLGVIKQSTHLRFCPLNCSLEILHCIRTRPSVNYA